MKVRLGVLFCCGVDDVRVGAVTFVTTVTICCDNNVTFFACAMMGVRRTLDILLSNMYFFTAPIAAGKIAAGKGTTKSVD